MSARRFSWSLVLGLVVTTLATAQTASPWRWGGPTDGYGLQPGRGTSAVPCGTSSFPCGLTIPLFEKSTAGIDWRLFGRLGASTARANAAAMGAAGADQGMGLSYGLGFSFDLSPRASASVGFDSHDDRFGGDPVRATRLGLQWRY